MKFKPKSILLLLLTAFALISSGQAVKIGCTEVLQDGDVLIHWSPLQIGSSFSDYTIYTSSHLDGPYSVLAVISIIDQSSFLHTGAGANADTVFYYIVTDQGGGSTTVTDTLATMLLAASTDDFEVVEFSWTPLHFPSPFLPEMYPWYFLYREYPPGNWAKVDSTQDLSLSHHFWSCNGASDTVRFMIGVRNDNVGCMSFSNQKGAVLKNQSNRFPPVMDSVSIDAGGKAILGWQPASEPDIIGYKIFQVTSTNDSIDYVDGRFSTSFIHQSSNPCDGPIRYIILSVDSCGNESPFPFDSVTFLDRPHSTIYLSDIQYDPCLMSNHLSWNEYKNFTPPLGHTDIYVSEDGGPYELLTTVFPGQVEYTHIDLLPNTDYSYYVRAFSEDMLKSSSSCRKGVRTYNSPKPLFMYTRFATVEDNERVNILFYTDTNAHVQYYRVLRSNSPSDSYTEAGIIENQGEEYVTFIDEEAGVTTESYYYQIEVIDSCGVSSILANTVRTIYLQTEALPDLSNRLTWNAYESWNGGIQGYRVYRRLDNASPDLIADLDSLTLTFTDNVSGLTGSISKITYLVEAYEGTSNIYGFREQSYSNEVLSEQQPKVYLPNAFAPRGINNMLKPVFVFVASEGYEFTIYNRWGQMIFQTTELDDGWDGRYNGAYVQQDVYVYLLKFRNALNQPSQIKGNVAVIY
jgi:gliding motility-associated-like protein